MTRTLFLHVGPPKTGTTSIQTFFRDNAAAFLRQGLFRPITGTERKSHFHWNLVKAFHPGQFPSELLDKLANELKDNNLPAKVLVTAEAFAVHMGEPAYVAAVKDFCQRLGYRLHILAYIRPQVPMLNSLYSQHVKKLRPVPPIADFIESECASGHHDYLSLFAAVLDDPDIDVTLRPFNRSTFRQGLVFDMCEVLGLDSASEALTEPETSNVSPGPRTIAALMQLRRQVKKRFPGLDNESLKSVAWPLINVTSGLGWNDEKFGAMSPGEQEALAGRFAVANEQLAQRIWSAPWSQVFSPEECTAPPSNPFDPAAASANVREEFDAFIEQAMDVVADFATTYHSRNGARR